MKGANLRERFEAYHKQYPGQQAAPEYLETLASVQRPVLQDANKANKVTPPTTTATTEGPEATEAMHYKDFRQLHKAERL